MAAPKQWSTVRPKTSREDRGDIRRAGDPLVHPELGYQGCQTLYEGFRHGHALNPLGPCLGFRAVSTNGMATPFIYSNYSEILSRVNCFAAGLETLKLIPPTEDGLTLIGLYMKNCMEWFIAEHAIFCVAGATVPFYDTLGPESVSFILKQTGTKTVVSTRAELERLCKVKRAEQCPHFEYVVLVDGVTPDASRLAEKAGLSIMSFAKVEAIGAQRIATSGHKHRPPSGKDVFTFCYTSGTTGDPKGAILTHENLVSAMGGAMKSSIGCQMTDRHLSYLPLAHIFERIVQCQIYVSGASIAFFRGDPLLLIEDMQACRPTILPAAPRVLNKIYDKVRVCTSTDLFDRLCQLAHFDLIFIFYRFR
jgi:long-chain acyl-CoA synthetase